MNRILVLGVLGAALAGCGFGSKTGFLDADADCCDVVDAEGVNHAVRLKVAANAAEFSASAKDALRDVLAWRWSQYGAGRGYLPPGFVLEGSGTGGAMIAGPSATAGAVPASADSSSSISGSSGTNVQEQGVDEADWVKSDGSRLYVGERGTYACCYTIAFAGISAAPAYTSEVKPPKIKIYALAGSPAAATPLATMSVGDVGSKLLGVYLSAPDTVQANRLTAVTQRYGQTNGTTIEVFDVANASVPTRLWRVDLEGDHVATRMIGSKMYLVSQFRPHLLPLSSYPGTQADYETQLAAIGALDVAAMMPEGTINGQAADLVSAGNCFVPTADANHVSDFALASVVELDLANFAAVGSACTLENSASIYASTSSVYLIANGYTPNFSESFTTLHKFEFSATGPVYGGSGTVPGHLGGNEPAFRLSEHNGVLRAVTTSGEWSAPKHRLFVLKPESGVLKTVAHLPSAEQPKVIGKPGEHIYAVRFFGNRGYVVTFKKIDPLYVLDLTDPLLPSVAGELEIPGYSDYLHPINESLLLGVGKDAVDADPKLPVTDRSFAWYQGVKVGLFDVSNPSQPRSLGDFTVGKRGSEAAVSQDYHAFTIASDSVSGLYRIAIPVQVHDGEAASSKPWEWAPWKYNGLHLFEVGAGAGAPVTFSATGVLKGRQATITGDALDSNSYTYPTMQRAVIVGDSLHYVESSHVWSAPWSEPQAVIGPQ